MTTPKPTPPRNRMVKLWANAGDFGSESMWAEMLDPPPPGGRQLYRLWNIPSVDPNLNLYDVVVVSPDLKDPSQLVIDGIAERGGQRTFRFSTNDRSVIQGVLDQFRNAARVFAPDAQPKLPTDALIKALIETLREDLDAQLSNAYPGFWLVSVPERCDRATKRLLEAALHEEAIAYFDVAGRGNRFVPVPPTSPLPPSGGWA